MAAAGPPARRPAPVIKPRRNPVALAREGRRCSSLGPILQEQGWLAASASLVLASRKSCAGFNLRRG